MRKRTHTVVVLNLLASSCGCLSMIIAESGKDLSKYNNRPEVRKSLGTPVMEGRDDEYVFEDYHFRGKTCDLGSSQGAGMVAAFTLGLSEFVVVPTMLFDLPRELRESHAVRYYYDRTGAVVRYEEQESEAED